MTAMRISRTAWPVTVLGPGRRAVIWTQGCTIGCHGCASRDTWDAEGGALRPVEDLLRWLGSLPEAPDGVTVSGGEPFQQPEALAALISGVRQALPEADILVFSGYTRARIVRDDRLQSIMESCDAVVAGPYNARAGYGGWLRGSANQELQLFTPLAEARYKAPLDDRPTLQVQVEAGRVDLIGIPKPGDLDRIAEGLGRRGWDLGEATWRS